MKVASSITNISSDATGLPSLLNSEADLLLPVGEELAAVSDDTASDTPTTSFDALLTMFISPQNLPLPPVATPISTVANNPSNANSANNVVSPASLDVLDIVALMPMPVATLNGDEGLSESGIPFTSDSPASKPESSVADWKLASAAALQSRGDFVVEDNSFPRVLDAQNAPATPVVAAIATLKTERLPSATFADSQKSATNLPVDHSHGKPGDLDVNQPPAEPKAESTSLANIERPPEFEFSPNGLPQRSAQPETTERPPRKPSDVADVWGPNENRHRPAAIVGRLTAIGAGTPPHVMETPANGLLPTNVVSLGNSLAATFQTRHNELVAGRPIELQLRLDPPELGTVRVHLKLTDETVSVRFLAGDEAVTRMLESQLPDLRQSLAERGLAFAQCHVSCDGGQSQAFAFPRAEPPPTHLARTRLPSLSWSSPLPVRRSILTQDDRLDVLA
jgi:flagellar hook-length control protein FliK